jgi:hypothetical protein
MKKNLFYLVFCLCAIVAVTDLQAQVTYKIKADSVKITNDNCSAELIIENSTRNVDGFLYNTGNGRTRFVDISGLFQPLENQRLSTGNSPTFTNQVLTGARLRFVNGANDIVMDGSDPGTFRSHYIKFRSQTADKGVGLQTLPGGIGNNVPYEFDFCTVPDGSAALVMLGDGPRQVHTIASLGASGTAWPIAFEVNPTIDPTDHQYDVIRLLTDRSIQFPQLGAGYLVTDATGKVAVVPAAGNGNSWSLTGNTGIDPSVNFIGTIDNRPLKFRMFNYPAGILDMRNVSFGFQSLMNDNPEGYNTAIGANTLCKNTTGSSNTAVGYIALFSNTTGYGNTGVGDNALYGNTTGVSNTAIGALAGNINKTGSGNTIVGAYAHTAVDNLVNAVALGASAVVSSNNTVVIGSSSIASIGGYANWSNFSDGRFKKNIKEDVPGLDFITRLRPVTYTLDITGINHFHGEEAEKDSVEERIKRTFKDKNSLAAALSAQDKMDKLEAQAVTEKEAIVHTGFVAQEVEKVADKIHYNFSGIRKPQNEKDNYTLSYADFVPSLVKAVQEQQKMIQDQQAAIEQLKKENEQLQIRVKKLEKPGI